MSQWQIGDRLVVIGGGLTPFGSLNVGKQGAYDGPHPRLASHCVIIPLEPMYDSNTRELFPAGYPGWAERRLLRKVEDPDKGQLTTTDKELTV